MRHRASLIVLSMLFATAPAQAQTVGLSPAQIGQIFCLGSLSGDMAPVEALLTPDLTTAIAAAWVASDAYAAANPGDKPPLGDGIPWRSWQDYADGCNAGAVTESNELATVAIDYSFSAEPAANYTDSLQLRPVANVDGMPSVWRIDDIELGDGFTLRAALAQAEGE